MSGATTVVNNAPTPAASGVNPAAAAAPPKYVLRYMSPQPPCIPPGCASATEVARAVLWVVLPASSLVRKARAVRPPVLTSNL